MYDTICNVPLCISNDENVDNKAIIAKLTSWRNPNMSEKQAIKGIEALLQIPDARDTMLQMTIYDIDKFVQIYAIIADDIHQCINEIIAPRWDINIIAPIMCGLVDDHARGQPVSFHYRPPSEIKKGGKNKMQKAQ